MVSTCGNPTCITGIISQCFRPSKSRLGVSLPWVKPRGQHIGFAYLNHTKQANLPCFTLFSRSISASLSCETPKSSVYLSHRNQFRPKVCKQLVWSTLDCSAPRVPTASKLLLHYPDETQGGVRSRFFANHRSQGTSAVQTCPKNLFSLMPATNSVCSGMAPLLGTSANN